MAKQYTIKCVYCGKVEKFIDTKAITHAKWKILNWNIATNEPVCLCDKCEYKPVGYGKK